MKVLLEIHLPIAKGLKLKIFPKHYLVNPLHVAQILSVEKLMAKQFVVVYQGILDHPLNVDPCALYHRNALITLLVLTRSVLIRALGRAHLMVAVKL